MDNQNETFNYTYSAREQEEVKNIRQKYIPQEPDTLERLRRLDQSATRKGTLLSVTLGVVGALLLGVGMSCTLVWAERLFIPGIVIGVAGILIAAVAYPVYARVTKKERERLAPEILRLTDELLK